MKKPILERYASDENGMPVLDVAAAQVSDLYSTFDRSSPHIRKDLDQNLVNYLIECARELAPCPFVIRFAIRDFPGDDMQAKIKSSIRSFFRYQRAVEKRNMGRRVRKSLSLLALGLGLLAAGILLNEKLRPHTSMPVRVLAEGMTVAAWVSLWEALATFLVKWAPHQRDLRLYSRLADAPVTLVRQTDIPD